MKLLQLTAVVSAVALSTTAFADNHIIDGNPIAVGVEAGTLGYGANVAWGVNDKVEVIAGWNGGSGTKKDMEFDDLKFDVDVDLSTPYLGVQLRPMSNWLTVGTGVMVPSNSFKGTAVPSVGKTFEYGGTKYSIDSTGGKLVADIENKNTIAPYLTLGFRPNINNRFGLFGEIGAAYTGGQNVDVQAVDVKNNISKIVKVNGVDVKKTINIENEIRELEVNAEKEINDKIADYEEWWPIVKIGATVRF